MKRTKHLSPTGGLAAALAVLLLAGAAARAADIAPADKPAFKPEELEQMLAPIALYPDDVLSQMLMASTYPLEVVQADRWVKQNKDLKSDALTKALEAQSWDASVKSLVNFPTVLAMMSDNLEVTLKIGDAFIGQQQQVLETIQKLRAQAQATGNLKSTPEQTVAVQPQGATQTIVIQPTNPQVVYIPTYSPTVYYAVWPYPAYPPVMYYPPGYIAGRALAFTAGVAVGAAWGYAWGHCDWGHGNVDIDINRHTDINANINRARYQADFSSRNTTFNNGAGSFQHDPTHRQGVAYRDTTTATQFGRASTSDAVQARAAFRGRTDTGALGLNSGGGIGAGNANRPGVGTGNVGGGIGGGGGIGSGGGIGNAGASPRPTPSIAPRPSITPAARTSALSSVNSGGAAARVQSQRGSVSLAPARAAAPARSFGGGGGARLGGRR